jgi:hypothetical protein
VSRGDQPPDFDEIRYKQRNLVERSFDIGAATHSRTVNNPAPPTFETRRRE